MVAWVQRAEIPRKAVVAVRLSAAVAMLVLVVARPAQATHFRSGDIRYTIPDPVAEPLRVRFVVTAGWRSTNIGSTILHFGDGTSNPETTGVEAGTGTDAAGFDWSIYQYTVEHEYPAAGSYTAYFEDCCRVSSLVNAGEAPYRVEAVVDLETPGNAGGAAALLPAVLQLQTGGVRVLPILAHEPDGAAMSCRFSTQLESGIYTNPPVISGGASPTIASTATGCELTWNTTGGSIGEAYAVSVAIESDAGKHTQDFIIELTPAAGPSCTGSGSFVLPAQEPFTTEVVGTHPTGGSLTVTTIAPPPGSALSPPSGSTGPSPLEAELSWTPAVADRGAHLTLIGFTTNQNLYHFCQLVLAVTRVSTTTLESDLNPSVFGQAVTFTATVTAGATGNVTFRNGETSLGTMALGPEGIAQLTTSSLTAGVHSITAAYEGDSAYGPSTSSEMAQIVDQAGTTVTLAAAPNPSLMGQEVTFTATVTPDDAGGTVTFKEGTTTLGTVPVDGSGVATFTTTALGIGSHAITAAYEGDANYQASTSNTVTQTVNSVAPANLIAVAASATAVSLTWTGGAATYLIERRVSSGAFEALTSTSDTAYVDSGLVPDTTYFYRIVAEATTSNTDLATTIVFTDDPIVAASTVIKAVHFTQLLTGVNALRAAASLPAVAFSDPVSPGSPVQASQMSTLRNGIGEAYTALGLGAITYEDPTLSQVMRSHVEDLRHAIR